jgi:hypothetical protein
MQYGFWEGLNIVILFICCCLVAAKGSTEEREKEERRSRRTYRTRGDDSLRRWKYRTSKYPRKPPKRAIPGVASSITSVSTDPETMKVKTLRGGEFIGNRMRFKVSQSCE